MGKVRDFLVQIPHLCGAKNAGRIADIFGYVYDRELEKGTPFDRAQADKDDFGNRSVYLWDMLLCDPDADSYKVHYCRKLMEIIERTHYLDKHEEHFHAKKIDDIVSTIENETALYPDIDAVMSVDEALMSHWSD